MGGMKISELDFVRLLPAFMREDETAIALSKAMNKLIGEPGKRLSTIRTWDKFDELSEAECDELAWELDVDWYDSAGMGLEEKRATLMLAQQIKRKRGTKWAVERLISAYFGEGYVMEWYDIKDAVPYTFIVLTTNTNITDENYVKFVEAVKVAKNERSRIAGIFYLWQQEPRIEYALESSVHQYEFVKCGTRYRTATVGFVVDHSIEIELETEPHLYEFTKTGAHACGTYPRTPKTGALIKGAIATEGTADFIRYNFKRQAGTYPRAAMVGVSEQHETAAAPEIAFVAYGFTKCGTKRCGQ